MRYRSRQFRAGERKGLVGKGARDALAHRHRRVGHDRSHHQAEPLPRADRIPPRERILAVAADLFYRHGIRAIGVESIAEAAGTNKMTLYRHFASKDELVAAARAFCALPEESLNTMKFKALFGLRLLLGLILFAAGSGQTGGLDLVVQQMRTKWQRGDF
jgi:hypothetical protein